MCSSSVHGNHIVTISLFASLVILQWSCKTGSSDHHLTYPCAAIICHLVSSPLRIREGRTAVDPPKLCVFLNKSTMSEHIQTYYTSYYSWVSELSNDVSHLMKFKGI